MTETLIAPGRHIGLRRKRPDPGKVAQHRPGLREYISAENTVKEMGRTQMGEGFQPQANAEPGGNSDSEKEAN